VLGERVEPTDPPRVVGRRGLLVCGVVGKFLRLVAVDDLLHLGGQGLLQPPGLGREGRQAGARACQNEAGQSARAAQGVLKGQPTAPGVTEHVDVVEPEAMRPAATSSTKVAMVHRAPSSDR
jgi:hypothetical protein